jgi:hypothetical protein
MALLLFWKEWEHWEMGTPRGRSSRFSNMLLKRVNSQ